MNHIDGNLTSGNSLVKGALFFLINWPETIEQDHADTKLQASQQS